MNINKIILIFIIVLVSNAIYAQDEIKFVRVSRLNDVERFQCFELKKMVDDFQYSEKVIRYDIDEMNEFVEMVFEREKNGKYFGRFDEYSITFKEGSDFYRYKEVIENVFQREGIIYITAVGFIKSERVCNKNICEIKVFNGKKLLFSKKDN